MPKKKEISDKIFIVKAKYLILLRKYKAEKNDAAKIIFIKTGTCTIGTAVFSAVSAKNEIRKDAGEIRKSAISSIKAAALSENGIKN